MAETDDSKNGFSAGRRWLNAFNAVVGLLALLGIIVMLNFVASGHVRRFQWASHSPFQLSPQTLRVLRSLTNDVAVTVRFNPRDQQDIYSLASALLAQYQNANPRFVHVTNLDYTRFPADDKALLDRLHLSTLKEQDVVIIEGNGQSRVFYASQLVGYDINDLITGRSKIVRRNEFKGEMYFTSAIFAVSNPRDIKTCFLYGHGEGEPSDEAHKLTVLDFSKLAGILTNEIDSSVQRLSLQGTNTVPADCQLLIIGGPLRPAFDTSELDKIDAYLKQGGRLLLLLDRPCGLEPLLSRWGLTFLGTPVVERDPNAVITGMGFWVALGPHPITNPLIRDRHPILLVQPHPIGQDVDAPKRPGGPEVTVLAQSTPKSQLVDPKGAVLRTDAFPLLCAVEQGGVKDLKAPRAGGTRIVVAGDRYFLDDQMIDTCAANHYFAELALNWLLERPDVLLKDLGPSPIREYRLELTPAQTSQLRWVFLAGMPGSVLLLGGVVWLRRRH